MVNFVKRWLNELDNLAYSKFQESIYLNMSLEKAEDMSGIAGENIVRGLNRAAFLVFVLIYGPVIFINTLVIFYPAYRSFESLEYGDFDEITRWIKYWIIFGMIRSMENVADTLIWWLPGYYFFQFIFLLWCAAPNKRNGSVVVYENYLRPVFLQNCETIDNVLDSIKNFARRPLFGIM